MRTLSNVAALALVAVFLVACSGLPQRTGKIEGYGGVFGERYGTIGGGK